MKIDPSAAKLDLNSLPDGVLGEVASHLGGTDQVTLLRTNKRLASAVNPQALAAKRQRRIDADVQAAPSQARRPEQVRALWEAVSPPRGGIPFGEAQRLVGQAHDLLEAADRAILQDLSAPHATAARAVAQQVEAQLGLRLPQVERALNPARRVLRRAAEPCPVLEAAQAGALVCGGVSRLLGDRKVALLCGLGAYVAVATAAWFGGRLHRSTAVRSNLEAWAGSLCELRTNQAIDERIVASLRDQLAHDPEDASLRARLENTRGRVQAYARCIAGALKYGEERGYLAPTPRSPS